MIISSYNKLKREPDKTPNFIIAAKTVIASTDGSSELVLTF